MCSPFTNVSVQSETKGIDPISFAIFRDSNALLTLRADSKSNRIWQYIIHSFLQVLKDLSLSFHGFQHDEIMGWIIRLNPLLAKMIHQVPSPGDDSSNLHITYASSNLFLLHAFMSSSANPFALVGHQLVYPNFFLLTLLRVYVRHIQTILNEFI